MEWGEDSDERLRELHARGMSCNAIGREMGVNAGIISTRARLLGLRFSQLKGMTEGRREQARAQRQRLREDLLEDAVRIRGQMFSPATVFNFGGRDNTFAQQTLDQPPTADQLKVAQALKTIIESIEKLDKMDSESDLQKDVGLLDELFAAMQEDVDLEDLL